MNRFIVFMILIFSSINVSSCSKRQEVLFTPMSNIDSASRYDYPKEVPQPTLDSYFEYNKNNPETSYFEYINKQMDSSHLKQSDSSYFEYISKQPDSSHIEFTNNQPDSSYFEYAKKEPDSSYHESEATDRTLQRYSDLGSSGYIIHYWKKQISNDKPTPSFLVDKASPLTTVQSVAFSKLVDNYNSLSANLALFCSAANLLCFPDVEPSLEKHYGHVNFIRKIGRSAMNDDKKRSSLSTYATKPTVSHLPAMKTIKPVKKWIESGKFFREGMLKHGTIMPMPDIRDRRPTRSFLPRIIVSKLPFSSTKIMTLKKIFNASENSIMESLIVNSLNHCERRPSQGESKRCVRSVEDMIDFATSILGRDIVLRTTDNTNGSGKKVKIGSVMKINGGKVTKSVSCHQISFPYLIYYCHSVPNVRVYEVDLLDPTTTSKKINHAVAICHLDTSSWSPTHAAFLSLGSKPGKIEVCHWIVQNDMTWVVSD